MAKDISADVAYIGGVWTEGVLYGIHIVVYFTLCYIFTSKAYTRGRETSSRILLTYSTVMFALSTAHVSLALQELFQGFIYERDSTPGGPPVFYRENVFPNRKALYIVNTLLGDSLLIWRVFVIYGRNWFVVGPSVLLLLGTIVCGFKTIAANAIASHSSVFDPSILSWVTSTFVLTIATQIIATVLIASRIYAASRPYSVTLAPPSNDPNATPAGYLVGGEVDRGQRAKYLGMVWLVVESGLIYTSAAIVQLVTYLLHMNAGVIMEFMLSQLSAMVPMVIVVRVGLGLAYDGPSGSPWSRRQPNGHGRNHHSSTHVGKHGGPVNLSTFQAATRADPIKTGDQQVSYVTGSSGTKLGSGLGVADESKSGLDVEAFGIAEKSMDEVDGRGTGLQTRTRRRSSSGSGETGRAV
ncbi:unnamed protein product [Cyclocybe aegerita]|uniref:Uncharacterized protein n=1 Tax=Cyclocybe aegerita TaxID=1973307 RepID=A0A8S0VTY6_CYCAE|nr:unnamed protein product [Cyclocybe aegerita]